MNSELLLLLQKLFAVSLLSMRLLRRVSKFKSNKVELELVLNEAKLSMERNDSLVSTGIECWFWSNEAKKLALLFSNELSMDFAEL